MGNSQSSENTDVYTYHEKVLKQGAEDAGSSESEDEIQEEFATESSPTNNNTDANDESEIINPVINSEASETSLTQVIAETAEPVEKSHEPERGVKRKEKENSEFITPPTSRESSPNETRRKTRSQVLRASTLTAVVNKKPRFSMRDSDDSEEEKAYPNKPAEAQKHVFKAIREEKTACALKQSSSIPSSTELQAPIAQKENETHSTVNTESKDPQSSGISNNPKTQSNIQLLRKNAVHLQKTVFKPSVQHYKRTSQSPSRMIFNSAQSNSNSHSNNNQMNPSLSEEKSGTINGKNSSVSNTGVVSVPNIQPSTSFVKTSSSSGTNTVSSGNQKSTLSMHKDIPQSSMNTDIHKSNTNKCNEESISTPKIFNFITTTLQDQSRTIGKEREIIHKSANAFETREVRTSEPVLETSNSEPIDVDMRDESVGNKANHLEGENIFLQKGQSLLRPRTSDFSCQASFENPDESSNAKDFQGTSSAEVQTTDVLFGNNPTQTSSFRTGLSTSLNTSKPSPPPNLAPTINPFFLIEAVQSISQLSRLETLSQESQQSASSSRTFHSSPSIPNQAEQYSQSYELNRPRSSMSSASSTQRTTSFPLRSAAALLAVQDKLTFPISVSFNITVKQGDIVKQDTEVIVNSTDGSLRHQGALSRSIAEAASTEMLFECQRYLQNHGGQLDALHVLDTCAGGRLDSNVHHIVHVVPPFGNSTHFDHLTVNKLTNAYLKCMLHSDRVLNSSSITFPLIGAASFPTDISINAFYNAVLIFQSEKRVGSRLNDVQLAINDQQIFQFAVDYFTSCYEIILTDGIDLSVAEALDSFYGNQKNSFTSYRIKDEEDGNRIHGKSKWNPASSFRNFFRGPPVKRPRL